MNIFEALLNIFMNILQIELFFRFDQAVEEAEIKNILKGNVRKPQQQIYTDKKSLQCDDCQQVFSTFSRFQRHK